MSNKRWKGYERRVARFFGTERTPLSGINSRHDTSSDTLHPKLYIEAKSCSGPTGSNGWIWRWLKKLDWPEAVSELMGAAYLLHSPVLGKAYTYTPTTRWPAAAWRLWGKTIDLAAKEGKSPLVALFCKGKRGFWLLGSAGAMLRAIRIREEMGNDEAPQA